MLKCYQKVNHFVATYQIARKTYLAKNLKRMQKIYPNDFAFFPRTWIIPNEMNDLWFCQELSLRQGELASKKENGDQKGKKESKKHINKYDSKSVGFTMICKPDHMSQGKGVFLTHDIDQIPTDELHVVQEYINHPFLIDGLKFDLRLYVLVMSCDPLKIFLHKEGLVRFATQSYQPVNLTCDKESLRNMFIHLTNYALNKENTQFKQANSIDDEKGHKRSLTSLWKKLNANGKDSQDIINEIKDIIIKTMLSI